MKRLSYSSGLLLTMVFIYSLVLFSGCRSHDETRAFADVEYVNQGSLPIHMWAFDGSCSEANKVAPYGNRKERIEVTVGRDDLEGEVTFSVGYNGQTIKTKTTAWVFPNDGTFNGFIVTWNQLSQSISISGYKK